MVYPYQLQSIAIAKNFKTFFNKNLINSIKFWDCPSNNKWFHHKLVDKDTKKFNIFPIFPCKALWKFNKKEECNNIIKNWQMIFQALEFKSNYFLDFLDNKLCIIEPLYTKERSIDQAIWPFKLAIYKSYESYYKLCSYRRISSKVLLGRKL